MGSEMEDVNMNNYEIIKKNMANKEPGYVYILTNPCYRADWVKIGKSRHPRRGIEYMD